ncbi:Pectate lyase superfamily protein [Neisseria animaloris]|uniref:right-handed parallel beta-helix repeat-containing protein n=1 Tax=Neisseria animaloris TaxID=326522 RepID=UPI000A23930A|nr:right-handed parallel beta-helix repeat-containing protein [Neisseria animaloris]OSI08315.1 hypothetical protein BWD08_03575 [Neisseria animaloris]VEH86695.1 Pectate lyase superfamily protein [Neisseria animaloris]
MSKQIAIAINKVVNGNISTPVRLDRYSLRTDSKLPLKIQAVDAENVFYQLTDAESGLAPAKLVHKQVGTDLYISFEDTKSERPDLIIEGYYSQTANHSPAPVLGMQNNGELATYPIQASSDYLLAEQITINKNAAESIIGGSKLLAALGGIAGAGLLGALAAGGGGSGGGNNDAPSVASPAKIDNASQPSFSQTSGHIAPAVSSASQTEVSPTPTDTKDFETKTETTPIQPIELNTNIDIAPVKIGSDVEKNIAPEAEDSPKPIIADENKLASEIADAIHIANASNDSADQNINHGNNPELRPSETSNLLPGEHNEKKDLAITDTSLNSENDTAEPSTPTQPTDAGTGQLSASGEYYIYHHQVYGKYIDAHEFGTDITGKTDSLAAIKAALAAAHHENAAVYLKGDLKISDQIVLNTHNKNVTGLFGDGMGATTVSFDKQQTGVFNSNTNQDDIRAYAGILVDGQNGKTIADLSVKYTNINDFYRPGESYFGKVSGILVNDADNTLISKVEVSGANRAGVVFTSTEALVKDPNGSGKTYKARIISGEIQEDYETLPLGENNRLVDSHLHHNRTAGALVAYQKNFVAEGNLFAWNGHEKDGGTGYGITAMAGSYNYDVTFRNNTTDHNYRKGFDVHDGNNIVIENNTAIGDRLYGIGVYNRQFSMDNVKITGNTIIQDPNFRLETDDNLRPNYHGYSGIQLQTNTQYKDLHSKDYGYFEVSGNTIKNLSVYKDAIQTYGIEFRNHEPKMDYTLKISGNKIEGDSTKYLIAVINNTKNQLTKTNGPGSGTIEISDNHADIGTIASKTMPIFINEHHTDGYLRGKVSVENNYIKVRENSNGSIEGIQMIGNAESYEIHNNTFELHGNMNQAIVSIHGRSTYGVPELNVTDNELITDRTNGIYRGWIEYRGADVHAHDNKHNGKPIFEVNHSDKKLELGIGGDSIVGETSASAVVPSPAKKISLLQADDGNGEAEENSANLVLSKLMSPAVVDLSGILGMQNKTAFTDHAAIPVYKNSSNIPEDDSWQHDNNAYIL